MGEAIQSRYYQQARVKPEHRHFSTTINGLYKQMAPTKAISCIVCIPSHLWNQLLLSEWCFFYFQVEMCWFCFSLVDFHCFLCCPWCRTNTPTASTSAQSWTNWSFMYKYYLKARWGKSGGCTWCCLDVVNRNGSLCSALLSGWITVYQLESLSPNRRH